MAFFSINLQLHLIFIHYLYVLCSRGGASISRFIFQSVTWSIVLFGFFVFKKILIWLHMWEIKVLKVASQHHIFHIPISPREGVSISRFVCLSFCLSVCLSVNIFWVAWKWQNWRQQILKTLSVSNKYTNWYSLSKVMLIRKLRCINIGNV